MADKYIVFKREEFDKFVTNLLIEPHILLHKLEEIELDDAIVIRRQDVFAPPALDAYANSIQIALSLGAVNMASTDHLRKVADFFHQQAVLSWNAQRKIPD